ncbi:hypothetical protein PCC9214_01230 [Planktothrix tepida]|uniref:BstEII n=1 Tax=Planktothrix tepida PCC 9214 TaxID=671072 RepID=A0A1J1LGD2_9CYAN|nr:hypothetical protein [Planktothrix tepida]CAD5930168.1 hypothetical protein PCC9214_01230 [Planktothrix tepida]CUR31528.1 conserved hypothetical protein [Planktothrix tepida PCC 9214]
MASFAEYKTRNSQYITFIDSEFYPDYLDEAKMIYGSVIEQFANLVNIANTSADLLLRITEIPNPSRTQLLRVFRKYVSPDTSVEMLKVKKRIPNIIEDYGNRFRKIEEVQEKLATRSTPDEALMAILVEYKHRGQKGYELTEAFFLWFETHFGSEYLIEGPIRAGRDIMLDEVLENWLEKTPADILISSYTGAPLVIGFARYDSDRGGAQEDDRISGNREKITNILNYADTYNLPLKVFFLNDGPGLTLGSMWNDYASLETYGKGRVMVCTLKMLDERFTKDWLEN